MASGKLKNGFEYEFDENIVKDWEFVKISRKIEDNPLHVIDFFEFVFTPVQIEMLEECCKDENGIVQTEAMFDSYTELIEQVGEVKN